LGERKKKNKGCHHKNVGKASYTQTPLHFLSKNSE
jgi:hypothetical protein